MLVREMDAGKIPISLGRDCPVKCEFCYELDHSYRETLDPPKTTDEDWKFILDVHQPGSRRIRNSSGVWAERLHGMDRSVFIPKAMEWVEDF